MSELPEEFDAIVPSLFPGWEDLDEEDQQRCAATARRVLTATLDRYLHKMAGKDLGALLRAEARANRDCGPPPPSLGEDAPHACALQIVSDLAAAVAPMVAGLRAENERLRVELESAERCGRTDRTIIKAADERLTEQDVELAALRARLAAAEELIARWEDEGDVGTVRYSVAAKELRTALALPASEPEP